MSGQSSWSRNVKLATLSLRRGANHTSRSPGRCRSMTVTAKYLLGEGVPITPAAVQAAAEAGSLECLDMFLQQGWNINQALRAAVRDFSVVEFLLNRNANPNTRCEVDKTPFSLAVENGSNAVIDLMLHHGADVKQGELIHHAIQREPLDTELLDMLVTRGAPFDNILYASKNQTQYERNMSAVGLGTQLHHAIIEGNVEAVRYLLKKGSSIDKTTRFGKAAQQIAMQSNASQCILNLIAEAREQRNM
nr:putative potassium channel akt5 [Quercus suber]